VGFSQETIFLIQFLTLKFTVFLHSHLIYNKIESVVGQKWFKCRKQRPVRVLEAYCNRCFRVTPSSVSLSGPSGANVGPLDFLYVRNRSVTGTLIFWGIFKRWGVMFSTYKIYVEFYAPWTQKLLIPRHGGRVHQWLSLQWNNNEHHRRSSY
jgi:hypothetical protein